MKLFLVSIWLAATLASAACATRPTGSGAPIVGSAALDFPPYDEVDGLDDYATRDTYRTAVNDRRFKMERLSYPSDGLQVLAYVYRPAAEPTTRLPVVIFNRGSWVRPAFHAELLPLAHRLAQAGFLGVAPM